MHTATIRDPITDTEIRIIANTYATLRQRVGDKIEQLRSAIIRLLWLAATEIVIIGLLALSVIDLISFGWVVVLLIGIVYIQRAPFWLNPVARMWYLGKCMRAWSQELERITAPDTKMGHDAL
jgi:hypothetical protein